MTHQTGFLFALVILVCSCDADKTESASQVAASPPADVAKSDDKPADVAKSGDKPRQKKDRGEMSMMLGTTKWEATSARARIKNKTLKISGSRMDGSVQTSMVRQALDLHIPDFNGPGTYEIPNGHAGLMSNFSVVGLDTKSIVESEGSKTEDQAQKDAQKELMKSLSGAKIVHLMGAKVEITKASDTEISGTFSFEDGKHMLKDGTFRAVVKQ